MFSLLRMFYKGANCDCRAYIDAARTGDIFCPKRQHNIPVLTCLNLPKKEELLRLFNLAVDEGIRKKKKFVMLHAKGLKELQRVM